MDALQHADHAHQLQPHDSQRPHGMHGAVPAVQEVHVSGARAVGVCEHKQLHVCVEHKHVCVKHKHVCVEDQALQETTNMPGWLGEGCVCMHRATGLLCVQS